MQEGTDAPNNEESKEATGGGKSIEDRVTLPGNRGGKRGGAGGGRGRGRGQRGDRGDRGERDNRRKYNDDFDV